MSNIIHFLDRKPVTYSIRITHYGESFEIQVFDVQDDGRSRLAVADDLEHAARMIREKHEATL